MTNGQQPSYGHGPAQNPTYGPMGGTPGGEHGGYSTPYPPYAASMYPPAWQQPAPPRPRPPLTSRQRRSALIAGGVAFPLMTLGFFLTSGILGLLLFGAFMRAVLGSFTGDDGSRSVAEAMDNLWAIAWWVPLIALIVSVGIWVGGYFASYGILKSGDVNKPGATTWAGLGVSIAGWFIVGNVLGMFYSFMPFVFDLRVDGGWGWIDDNLSYALWWTIPTIVANIATGALCWWWMAHCIRARAGR